MTNKPLMELIEHGARMGLPGQQLLVGWMVFDVRFDLVEFGNPGKRLCRQSLRVGVFAGHLKEMPSGVCHTTDGHDFI
jgi:hypothetical protein